MRQPLQLVRPRVLRWMDGPNLREKEACMQAPATNETVPLESFAISAEVPPAQLGRTEIERTSGLMLAHEHASGAFGRCVGFIARQYRTILIVTLLSIVAASVKLQSITPLYTISARIMIQHVAENGAPPSAEDRQRTLRNEQELIVSTPVLASALATPTIHDLSPLHGQPDSLKLLKQQLHVESGDADDLLEIGYDTIDPRTGTRVLTSVVDSYIRFRSGLREMSGDGSAATVSAEKRKALDVLAQKRAELQQFSVKHGIAAGNEEVDAADSALHELGVKLAQAHVETVAAQAAYDQMQHDLADDPRMKDQLTKFNDNDSALASGDDQAIAKQICTLQTQLAGLGTKFMANYEPVQLLHRRIDDLKLTRDAIIQQRWQATVRTESELRASFLLEQSDASASEMNKQAFEQRLGDVQDGEKQVAMFDKQLRDLESATKLITTMVTVIEPPTASDRPTRPRSTAIVLISALAGLVLGCGFAVVRDLRTETPVLGDIKTLGAGLPVLARLPAVPRRQLAMNSWRDRAVDSAAEFAEACRKVHAAIESVVSFSGARTVLITSTNVREGKSTLASLLALTLAQTGKRVLLVDANLHAPVQGDIFGIEGTYGLGELLEEEIESSFVSYVHPGSDPRMEILLSGSATVDVPDLLNSQRFTNLMAAMAAEYDLVLIDSPALAAGSDARIIASACDATIVLARESGINRKALSKTRDSLTSVGGNVIGVVLNGGMSMVTRQQAFANVDVPAIAAPRLTPTREPAQVTTVRLSPAAEPVQSVVAAQVRRAVEDIPEGQLAPSEDDRFQWIWSYLLTLVLLLGGWMAFNAAWGGNHSAIAKDPTTGRLLIHGAAPSLREEPVATLMAGSGLLVAILIGAFIIRPPRQELAVMALGGALTILAFYSGTSNLLIEQQPRMILSFTAQAILLFASLLFAWSLVRRISSAGRLEESEPNSAFDYGLAIFAQASAMSALTILLSHWQSKGECLAVIAFSSCLSAMIAYWISPLRSSLCFWLSPLAVALFGYACVAVNAHGLHLGVLLTLARALPMDYASMGPIGALLGFWIARSSGRIARPSAVVVG